MKLTIKKGFLILDLYFEPNQCVRVDNDYYVLSDGEFFNLYVYPDGEYDDQYFQMINGEWKIANRSVRKCFPCVLENVPGIDTDNTY